MNLSQDELKRLLNYDPQTGDFIWKVARAGRAKAGTKAGKTDTHGHRQIMVQSKFYAAHRLAFLYMNGEFPSGGLVVDHINGTPADNRWDNLRLVTQKQNCENIATTGRKSHSRLLGAHFVKSSNKWQSKIMSGGKQLYLGRFDAAEQAHAAYLAAKASLHSLPGH